MKKRNTGFTLIEMLIVVTIIGILAAVVLPRFTNTSATAKKNAHKAERMHINTQIEMYYYNNSENPVTGNISATTFDNSPGDGSSKNYFPDGAPTQCNQESAWEIQDGRLVPHGGHE